MGLRPQLRLSKREKTNIKNAGKKKFSQCDVCGSTDSDHVKFKGDCFEKGMLGLQHIEGERNTFIKKWFLRGAITILVGLALLGIAYLIT